ncbi:MAG TPA: hypothetical protein VHW65_04970 [Gemmatimonadales bacterium]|nr:hypothetical protein [Gemmatimonadales bacterium]
MRAPLFFVRTLRRFRYRLARHDREEEAGMLDVVYVLGSIAFFWLMALYVRACEALGRSGGGDGADR